MINPPRRTRRPNPEDRRFLDQLVFLRGIYSERGAQDSVSSITLMGAIAEAEVRMQALRRRDDLRRRFAQG